MWEYQSLIKKLKKEPIYLPERNAAILNYNHKDIQQIIPHRQPFLMIDRLTKVNLNEQVIEVERHIDPTDPVFAGHFPKKPVYPGVLQIEIMGQAGLCLAHFIIENSLDIPQNFQPIKGLFTKVHHAMFINSILPGDSLVIIAKMIERDEFFGLVGSQILKNHKICSLSLLEVYFDE